MGDPRDGWRRRCKHIKRDGTQCKRPPLAGLDVCSAPGHGGSTPNARKRAAVARVEAKLVQKGYGNTDVDRGHEGANPISGLAWELRRTAGNIVFLQEKLAEMRDEDIVWGQTLEETKLSAGHGKNDESYGLTRDEARVNLWVQLFLKERTHYAGLCKLGIAAGFEAQRQRILEEQVLSVNAVLSNIIAALGHDPDKPEVRALVRDQLLELLPVPVADG